LYYLRIERYFRLTTDKTRNKANGPILHRSNIINSSGTIRTTIIVLSPEDILRTDGLNTVTFSDPYAKICFTTMITRALTYSTLGKENSIHKRVLYIDTDTVFTAYLMAGLILRENHQNPIGTTHNNNNDSGHHYNYNNYINNYNKSEGEETNNNNTIINFKSKNRDERLVQVFLPSEGRFESLLGDAIASMPEASIVIFDSLNSFYNMYPGPWYETEIIEEPAGAIQKASHGYAQESNEQLLRPKINQKKTHTDPLKEKNTDLVAPSQKSAKENEEEGWSKPKSPYTVGRLNHLLSIFVMLLVQHGIYYKIPVLVTSMVRYKKVSEDIWVKAPACRRLLNQKSMVRLSVEMINDNDLSVKIMKHPSLEQQSIVYPNVGISLVSP
jgi:hypothetical protein